jgi:hypothetical protein
MPKEFGQHSRGELTKLTCVSNSALRGHLRPLIFHSGWSMALGGPWIFYTWFSISSICIFAFQQRRSDMLWLVVSEVGVWNTRIVEAHRSTSLALALLHGLRSSVLLGLKAGSHARGPHAANRLAIEICEMWPNSALPGRSGTYFAISANTHVHDTASAPAFVWIVYTVVASALPRCKLSSGRTKVQKYFPNLCNRSLFLY